LPRDPREIHDFEQMHARLKDIAAAVGSYKQMLESLSVPEGDAWESARKMEDRLADIAFGEFEETEYRRMVDQITTELIRELDK
jgi:hypothetical protein